MVHNVDRIKDLGQEIMESCHPNAIRFVKYYLTITHTRWEQVGLISTITKTLHYLLAFSRFSRRHVSTNDMVEIKGTRPSLY